MDDDRLAMHLARIEVETAAHVRTCLEVGAVGSELLEQLDRDAEQRASEGDAAGAERMRKAARAALRSFGFDC